MSDRAREAIPTSIGLWGPVAASKVRLSDEITSGARRPVLDLRLIFDICMQQLRTQRLAVGPHDSNDALGGLVACGRPVGGGQ